MTTSIQGARTPKGAEPALQQRQESELTGSELALLDCAEHARLPADRPLRVLYVSAGLAEDGGGIAAASRLLLAATRRWARERGAALRVLTLGNAEELPNDVEGEAVAGDRRRLALAVWRAQRAGFSTQVYDFLGTARIQGLLPASLRSRYLLFLWGLECWRPLGGTRRRAVEGASVRLACSRFTIAEMRHHNPRMPAVETLPLALRDDAGPAGEADGALLRSIGTGFLLIVGRMAPGERYKGHDELLAALARLRATHPRIRLVVAGEGRDRARLAQVSQMLGVADRVTFTGYVSTATLAELYRRCAVFAMPSHGEGFGLVYLEAMRAGRPCVALAESAAAEIVEDGVTGRLIERGVHPLVEALAAMLATPDRAEAMGAAGRIRFERLYRESAFAERLRPHLDTLLAGAPAAHRLSVEAR